MNKSRNRKPLIALVGRPNVGKSALFNRMCGKRLAITDEEEGVTRDRLYADGELFGTPFTVIDTGGIDPKATSLFSEEVCQQAEIAIEEADSIIMVVDSRIGITPLDEEVAKILHRTDKPLCLAVNKVDNLSQEALIHSFHALGIGNIIAVSATQNWRMAELLEAALHEIPQTLSSAEEKGTQIAVIGRPNVGKSSLVNYLLDKSRCIISPIAGTTRDSIDTPFTYKGNPYTLIDTAGIRRKAKEPTAVDKFAALRTERAIDRADLCLLLLDAQQGLTTEDKKITQMIEEKGKGCILLFNKWDLVKGFRMEHCLRSIEEDALFLKHCPKIFISAKTGKNVPSIFDPVLEVASANQMRIPTAALNKLLELSLKKHAPAMHLGKRLRIYYMAQVGINPPTFVYFINSPHLMQKSYQRYLYNQMRATYPFPGVPLVFHYRRKKPQPGRAHIN